MALTAQQQLFVDALLGGMTPTSAARYVKVGEQTGRRWWREVPGIRAEFLARCREARDLTIARVQTLSLASVETLGELQEDAALDPTVRRAAASDMLRYFFRGVDRDFLEELREIAEEMRGGGAGAAPGGPQAQGDAQPPPQPPDALPG